MSNDPAPGNEPTYEIPFSLDKWEQYPLTMHGKKKTTFPRALEKTLEQLARLLPSIKKSSKILVISSGSSFVAGYIAHNHGSTIDLACTSEEAAKQAQKELKGSHVEEKINISVNPLDSIILERSYYDIVWSLGEMFGQEDTLKLFKDIARSLAPEGRFIMLEVFDTFKDEVELPGYEHITTIDNYLRRARRADLERVYAKDYPEKTIKHYSVLAEALESKKSTSASDIKSINALLEYAQNKSITWGIVQLQKRND